MCECCEIYLRDIQDLGGLCLEITVADPEGAKHRAAGREVLEEVGDTGSDERSDIAAQTAENAVDVATDVIGEVGAAADAGRWRSDHWV